MCFMFETHDNNFMIHSLWVEIAVHKVGGSFFVIISILLRLKTEMLNILSASLIRVDAGI